MLNFRVEVKLCCIGVYIIIYMHRANTQLKNNSSILRHTYGFNNIQNQIPTCNVLNAFCILYMFYLSAYIVIFITVNNKCLLIILK